MLEIKEYCCLLYQSLQIPVYLYKNKTLILNYPQQGDDILPPMKYLDKLWSSDKTISCTMTFFYSYYGCVILKNTDYSIVLGPVNSTYYTNESIHQISKDFSVKATKDFADFFYSIPITSIIAFLKHLNLINYIFNFTNLSIKEIDGFTLYSEDDKVNQIYSDYAFAQKEDGLKLHTHYLGNELMRYVEIGNLDAVKKYFFSFKELPDTLLAGTKLRHFRNLFISTITLVCNTAINSGLSPTIALMKSEVYIQQMERINNPEMIAALLQQSVFDFTSRIAEMKLPSITSSDIRQANYYIKENVHQNITVSDVARHVGFSRNYFSERFKAEMGIGLRDYIRKCKLEDTKELLKYTNKSISEISSFFGFSSQSHFQKAFKNHYGITPLAYRKKVSIL